MIYMRLLLVVLSFAFLLTACASKEKATRPEVSLYDAQQECYYQAQGMSNQPINTIEQPGLNKFFSNCMQVNYGYSVEEINEMSFEVK